MKFNPQNTFEIQINSKTLKTLVHLFLIGVVLTLWYISNTVASVEKELSQLNYMTERSTEEMEIKNFQLVLEILKERESQAIWRPIPKYCDHFSTF